MKPFHVSILAALLFASGCKPTQPPTGSKFYKLIKPADNPTVTAEKARWISEGWEFVTVVGTARGKVEAREVRYSDPETGSLTVIAPSSGLPGESRGPEERRTFQERGYRFLEVKIMTSVADGYGIVFRKKA